MSLHKSKIISGEASQQCQSWQMPIVSDNAISSTQIAQQTPDLADIKQAAFDEGYANGQQQVIADVNAKLAELNNMLEGLVQPLDKLDESLEEVLSKVIIQLTQQCLQQSITIKPELIINMVKQALLQLNGTQLNSQLMLNQADKAVIEAAVQDKIINLHHCELIADPCLNQGEFRLQSNLGDIDATVVAQLEQAKADCLTSPTAQDDVT